MPDAARDVVNTCPGGTREFGRAKPGRPAKMPHLTVTAKLTLKWSDFVEIVLSVKKIMELPITPPIIRAESVFVQSRTVERTRGARTD